MAVEWPFQMFPPVRLAGLYPMDANEVLPFSNREYLALHIHFYCGTISIGNQSSTVNPGDVTLTPAWTDSTYHLSVPGKHWVVHFEPEKLSTGRKDTFQIPFFIPLSGFHSYALSRFMAIAKLVNGPCVSEREKRFNLNRASAVLQELLIYLSQNSCFPYGNNGSPAGGSREDAKILDGLLLYIEEHLYEPISIPQLADMAGIGQNKLSGLFRDRFGYTIKTYLLQRRIDKAVQLMLMSDTSIKNIAISVGFRDLQYFNKQFRKVTGLSPRAFRLAEKT